MVWLALAVVYVVWGSTYFAIALVVQTMPPLLTAGARHFTAGALMAAWLFLFQRDALRVTRREAWGAALVGVLLMAGGNGLVVLGERSVASGLAALIIASVPLWLVVFRRVTGERVGNDLIAGVTLGLAGVAILVVPSGASGGVDPIGLVMILTAALSWSIGTFISQRIALPRSIFASAAVQMVSAGAVLLVLGGALGEGQHVDASRFSLSSLIALGYLVIFGSLIAYSAYTWLLQHAPVSLVSTYAYVNPVVAVFLGTVFLAEPIAPTTIAGAALIIAAVAFIVTRIGAARRAAAA
jgi:drug/metabolite transporter (DMT)-like permease